MTFLVRVIIKSFSIIKIQNVSMFYFIPIYICDIALGEDVLPSM